MLVQKTHYFSCETPIHFYQLLPPTTGLFSWKKPIQTSRREAFHLAGRSLLNSQTLPLRGVMNFDVPTIVK